MLIVERPYLDRVIQDVLRDGIAITRASSEREFKALMSRLGDVHQHPHADADGVTRIKPTRYRLGQPAAGFSNDSLGLHTDRSSVPIPPRFLGVYFERQAVLGGTPIFADLSILLDKFERPDLERVKITNPCGDRVPILISPEKPGLRYRDDAQCELDGPPTLVAEVRRTVATLRVDVPPLTNGDVYILDNHRMAHGRTAFDDANRSILRLLVDENP